VLLLVLYAVHRETDFYRDWMVPKVTIIHSNK
jgi:hypothetical protein